MNSETNTTEYNPDIFDFQFEEASTGKRFLNYLIDVIFMQIGLSFLTGILLAQFLLIVSPETANRLFGENPNRLDAFLLTYLLSFLNFIIYYTFCEKLFNGYTLGKLITGTRAIREDGKELTFKDAILRSLSRLFPFEPFSALWGTPWHDSWTNTIVIRSR